MSFYSKEKKVQKDNKWSFCMLHIASVLLIKGSLPGGGGPMNATMGFQSFL